jgi:predicted amidohydrolase
MAGLAVRMAVLALLQTAPAFGAVAANLDRAEALLAGRRADLLVLPELFATGYSFRDRAECQAHAEPFPDGPSVRRLAAMSERSGGTIVAGFAESAGARVYNAAAVVHRGRPLHAYRKLHLFGFERECFDPGDGPLPVVEAGGLRIGVMICFDWMFPEAARVLALSGADVIAHPSNLVLPWCQRAMPVRALENGVYTVTANRVGSEARAPRPALRFTGGSLVAGPDGAILASAGADEEGWLEVAAEPERARNKRLPSGNDRLLERRPEHYGSLLRPPGSGP